MWNALSIRKVPKRFAVGPGSEPKTCARLRVMGKMMPPPRAVSEGTNGANTRFAPAIEYPSVSALRPNRWIKR